MPSASCTIALTDASCAADASETCSVILAIWPADVVTWRA
jgi:hypothetical protein